MFYATVSPYCTTAPSANIDGLVHLNLEDNVGIVRTGSGGALAEENAVDGDLENTVAATEPRTRKRMFTHSNVCFTKSPKGHPTRSLVQVVLSLQGFNQGHDDFQVRTRYTQSPCSFDRLAKQVLDFHGSLFQQVNQRRRLVGTHRV
jgi:hypothetical protein